MLLGEASGDILGAGLIRALREHYPALQVEGIGGPLMEAEGCRSFFPQDRLAVMGFDRATKAPARVIENSPLFTRIFLQTRQMFLLVLTLLISIVFAGVIAHDRDQNCALCQSICMGVAAGSH